MRLADISLNEDTSGSVILWVTPAGTTLPRSMPGVSQSFYALLQKNVLDQRRWRTRDQLASEIIVWIEHTYNRRRRQRSLGKLTPVEFELAITEQTDQAA